MIHILIYSSFCLVCLTEQTHPVLPPNSSDNTKKKKKKKKEEDEEESELPADKV